MGREARRPRTMRLPPGETLGEAWADYLAKLVMPAGAGAAQIEETKRAFYAGALVGMHMLTGIGIDVPDDEAGIEQGAKRIESALREAEDYFEGLGRRHRATHG